jgi:hypothetical protein
MDVRIANGIFVAACSPQMLTEVLECFLELTRSVPETVRTTPDGRTATDQVREWQRRLISGAIAITDIGQFAGASGLGLHGRLYVEFLEGAFERLAESEVELYEVVGKPGDWTAQRADQGISALATTPGPGLRPRTGDTEWRFWLARSREAVEGEVRSRYDRDGMLGDTSQALRRVSGDFPILSEAERANLLRELKEAEADLAAGRFTEFDPATFKAWLHSVRAGHKPPQE